MAQSPAARRRGSGDGSVVSRPDRPRARDDGVGGISHGASGGETCDRMAQEKSVVGGWMVGTLGDQLYLWNFLGAVGPARDRRRYERAVDQALGRMAEVEAESGRRMGRKPAVGQGCGVARARDQYRVANGVGFDRIDRRRVGNQRACDARRAMALRATE